MNIGTKIESLFKGFWDNTMAVSPVVASLVLVTVAITGAAGVGMIQGNLASDIAEGASAGDMGTASSTELLIAGSTTVQPVSELIAEAYMNEYQGIKVTVQGGGSGAGVSSTGMDIVDIGAASRAVKDSEAEKYPDLITHKIGGSGVVVIVNNASITKATVDEILAAYQTGAGAGNLTGITEVFDRAEESGTEDTFRDWLNNGADVTFNSTVEGKQGNAGVLDAVKSTSGSIGFVDFGFADGADVTMIDLYDNGVLYTTDKKNIKDQLKDTTFADLTDDKYPGGKYGLIRPLNYMTNGEPTSMEQAFITFAMSPGATTYFEECGYFAITSFA